MKKAIKILNVLMIIISLALSGLIFINKDYSLTTIKKIYNVFDNFLLLNDSNKTVSSQMNFIKINENYYYNDSYCVYSPFKATVINYDKNSIYLKCDNSYIACLKNLINVNVSKYDVVVKGDKLANFVDYFELFFIKGESVYSYEQVLENHR